ncbi:MAG: ATP-binding cassette domain-containing protein, partial [Desulfobacteraceae bacterium]
MEKTLEIQRVSKSFGGLQALWDVNVSLNEGETVGLIGPNGAGKTTLFNIICGMKPDTGKISFRGDDITGLRPNEICHKGIARTFQLIRPFTNLSVLDNVSC